MRELVENHKNSLEHCTVYETLFIELASGAVFHFAVGEVDVNDETYLGRLTLTAPLRMSLTKASDNVSFEIDNTNLELGQALIVFPNAFDSSFAVLGAYFKNNETNEEWHDEKIPGEISVSTIDGDKVVCSFLSEVDAAKSEGRLISEVFPNAQLERQIITPIDDQTLIGGRPDIIERKLSILYDDIGYGRYYLPDTYLM